LADVILRFGSSQERRRILDGLLRYRAELHRAGLVQGFQWLDGSFFEDVERLEGRSPQDVDVVTFLNPPEGAAEDESLEALFDRAWIKASFFIDHYVVELSLPGPQLVSWSAYWYSVWSHRRDLRWKGYLEIDLDPEEDETARVNLTLRENGEGRG
jgi:hypothetical protein